MKITSLLKIYIASMDGKTSILLEEIFCETIHDSELLTCEIY